MRALNAVLMATVLSSTAVIADDSATWVNFGGVSYHFTRANQNGNRFNEINSGLGIELPYRGTSVGLGGYRNSLGKTSHYAAVEKIIWRHGVFGVGGMAGVVDGYPLRSGGWMPLVLPTLVAEAGNVGLRLVYVPEIEKKVSSVVSLQLRVRIN